MTSYPLQSIVFMLASIVVGAGVDATKKFFVPEISLLNASFAMYLGLAVGGTVILSGKGLSPYHIKNTSGIALASILSLISGVLSLWMIREFHLMEYRAILSTTDLWIILWGALFLKEGFGFLKALGSILCFSGLLICTKTGAPTLGWVSILMIAVVFLTTARIILAKYILKTDTREHYLFYTTWPPALGLGIGGLLSSEPLTLSLPFFMVGLARYLHKWLHISALKTGPLSIVGSLSYGEIIFAGTFGYLLFDRIPDTLSMTGAGIIIMGILMVLYSQKASS